MREGHPQGHAEGSRAQLRVAPVSRSPPEMLRWVCLTGVPAGPDTRAHPSCQPLTAPSGSSRAELTFTQHAYSGGASTPVCGPTRGLLHRCPLQTVLPGTSTHPGQPLSVTGGLNLPPLLLSCPPVRLSKFPAVSVCVPVPPPSLISTSSLSHEAGSGGNQIIPSCLLALPGRPGTGQGDTKGLSGGRRGSHSSRNREALLCPGRG